MREYEVVCTECGESFKTFDKDQIYCTPCWEKVVFGEAGYPCGKETPVAETEETEEE